MHDDEPWLPWDWIRKYANRTRQWWSGKDLGMDISAETVGEVTQLLSRWNIGDPAEHGRLLHLVYPELKRIAEFRMRRERWDHTLQATALVNEFIAQLYANPQLELKDRKHLLSAASQAMRHILVDYARTQQAGKRGGQLQKIPLEGVKAADSNRFCDILELNELLDLLAKEEPRMARVVELRYFGGLSNSEIADVLQLTERTVKRDWQVARAWLYAQLRGRAECSPTNGKT
jgi:RNA polymerase sigma-70 factor, ECF subfamily